MKVEENKKKQKKEKAKKPQIYKKKEDFSHIKGDSEDFIFFFTDNKRHSEK